MVPNTQILNFHLKVIKSIYVDFLCHQNWHGLYHCSVQTSKKPVSSSCILLQLELLTNVWENKKTLKTFLHSLWLKDKVSRSNRDVTFDSLTATSMNVY